MVEVKLVRIIINESKKEQVIILQEKRGNRQLPIIIGLNEAMAIKMHLSKITTPRPLTHDLLQIILERFSLKLSKVVIDNIVDNTFYAKLYITTKNNEFAVVDARPSDSIALAVRAKAPIFVEPDIFEKLSQ